MTYFTSPITVQGTDFTQTFVADTLSLDVHFRWDMNLQEQWDILDRNVKNLGASDPLINLATGEIIKDYDYLQWYLNWNEEVVEIPQSLKNTDEAVRINIIKQRQTDCIELNKIYSEMRDRLAWYIDVTVNEEVYTGIIRPRGWIFANDDSWCLMFNTEAEKVSRDNLGIVTLVVGVA